MSAHSDGNSLSMISAPGGCAAARPRLRAPPCPSGSASSQCGVRHSARRGGRSGMRGGSYGIAISAARNSAMSSTERAIVPTVSRLSVFDVHAGRREQAEARLEPDDAAIGRRADHRAAGLRADRQRHHEVGDRRRRAARRAARACASGCAGCEVGPGWRLANSVVTVLPSRIAAGRARQRRRAGIEARPAAGIDRRAVAGRHVGGVEDVLDAERHAPEHAAPAAAVGLPAPRRAPAPGRDGPRPAPPGRARGCGRGSSGRRPRRSARRPRSAGRVPPPRGDAVRLRHGNAPFASADQNGDTSRHRDNRFIRA